MDRTSSPDQRLEAVQSMKLLRMRTSAPSGGAVGRLGRRKAPNRSQCPGRALTPLYVKTAAQEASLSCWRVRKSLMTR